jgi:CHAT domain-containing protein
VRAVGAAIPQLTLHESLLKAVRAVKGQALAIVHDGAASYVPWETLNVGGWFPALTGGLSRRLQSSDLVPARFDAKRREDAKLSVLLIANPTRDLPGAEAERTRVAALLAQHKHIDVVEVRERAATLTRIVAELESGRYDLVHYAGHAFFDAARPETSGLVLADGHLTGSALADLTRLPPLVFFNACESGRVRRRGEGRNANTADTARRDSALRNVGLAETLLRAGVANYIGTHWPVGDAAASEFAGVLYARLLKRDSIGDAMLAARRAVHALRSPDWADYIHYGDPEFELKTAP